MPGCWGTAVAPSGGIAKQCFKGQSSAFDVSYRFHVQRMDSAHIHVHRNRASFAMPGIQLAPLQPSFDQMNGMGLGGLLKLGIPSA